MPLTLISDVIGTKRALFRAINNSKMSPVLQGTRKDGGGGTERLQ